MVEAALTCRHCSRPIAVPASNCPWCGLQIMVICANCKGYTDDQKPFCGQCGVPLQPDRMEQLSLLVHHPEVARLAQDQERAQLVASAVVVNNASDFLYDDGRGYRTVLVELFASGRDRKVIAAGVLFAAYAYLCEKGYCALRLSGGEEERQVTLDRLRPWDGQQSVEGALIGQMERAVAAREVTDKAIRALMGFRTTLVRRGDFGRAKTVDGSARSAFAAIDQVARITVLPAHDRKEACRATYGLLVSFTEADRERARLLALETLDVLGWFEQFERDPAIKLRR
jgi:hypothetical protein